MHTQIPILKKPVCWDELRSLVRDCMPN